jgi:hypothetical protein
VRSNIAAALLAILCVGWVGGCSSISGNRIVEGRDANGNPSGKVDVTPVSGLPIVVQIPNKAVFIATVKEFSVTRVVPGGVDAQGNPTITTEKLANEFETTISPQPVFLGRPQVYTIDPKRPAFGTIDYGIDLANYYPTKFAGKVDDKTLSELTKFISDTLSKVLPTPGAVVKQAGEQTQRTLVAQSTRLVIFDLESNGVQIIDPQTIAPPTK